MEEIIIDGVDVSKCKFYYDEICDDCYLPIDVPYCEGATDCYYKQLKRKEKECEELKKYFKIKNFTRLEDGDFVFTSAVIDEFVDENNKLKQTLQEIKEIASVWFVDGLNEEADYYNTAMRNILQKLNEVEE